MHEKEVGKIIDKYRIESILESKPNGICIMRAINATTNQSFVIKKAAISKEPDDSSSLTSHSQETRTSQSESGLLYNEVNSIKQMSVPRVLKCHQMIKTKRSLYLVYENYPQLNLEKYLKQRAPVPALRIRFAKIICELLQEIHKKQYIYSNLMPSSIFVISGSNLNTSSFQLRFVGFQYAKKIKEGTKNVSVDLDLYESSPYVAPQILQSGLATKQSDIYSAGKIFQLLGLTQIKGKTDSKLANQTISDMLDACPEKRSNLTKVWQCLKLKQNEARLFDHKVLELHINRSKMQTGSSNSQQKIVKAPLEKRNVEQEERRLKKILKIRSLVIYLHDLANFSLKQKSKALFYMLIKKSIIVRANLLHELKKMLSLYSGEHYSRLSVIKQTLVLEQNESLNLLSKAEQNLKIENVHNSILCELENRNELNEQLMEEHIHEFICKKKREIRPFHSILDEQERNKLINLCGLAEKLVYGSFEKFFDEVVDDSEVDLSKQKYFGYLKSASTKQIFDRLQKILKEKSKIK